MLHSVIMRATGTGISFFRQNFCLYPLWSFTVMRNHLFKWCRVHCIQSTYCHWSLHKNNKNKNKQGWLKASSVLVKRSSASLHGFQLVSSRNNIQVISQQSAKAVNMYEHTSMFAYTASLTCDGLLSTGDASSQTRQTDLSPCGCS